MINCKVIVGQARFFFCLDAFEKRLSRLLKNVIKTTCATAPVRKSTKKENVERFLLPQFFQI